MNTKNILLESAKRAIAAADPMVTLEDHLPIPPKGHTYVIGAGKAAARMAQAFEKYYDAPFSGVVVTRYGHNLPTRTIKVIEASHPIPDEAGQQAAEEILATAQKAGADDLVVCLLSGGGSALLSHAAQGIDFEDYRDITLQLLKSGASIHEINTVRKHLSSLFGGKLARAVAPAKLVTLSISDVTDDDPSTIASGPTVADPTTLEDTAQILQKYTITTPTTVEGFLKNTENETPKPGDALFENTDYILIARPQQSLEVGAAYLREQGIETHILTNELEGDTNQAASFHAAIARQVTRNNQPFQKPCAIISGGETTVMVKGDGKGGPNTQFALAMAIECADLKNMAVLACDTDGIDGIMDNAGAYIDKDTLVKAAQNNLCPNTFIENNDSYSFFQALDDLIITGPTHTNVNDFRVIYIGAQNE